MKYFFLLFILSLLIQDGSNAILWDPEIRPTWSDFQAEPEEQSAHTAATHYLINAYINYEEGSDIEYRITCNFVKDRSWVKPVGRKNADLLAHELLHFDIAECRARDLRRMLQVPVIMEDAVPRLKHLKDSIRDQWRLVQKRYDKETDHGQRPNAQLNWETQIDSILTSFKEYSGTDFTVTPLD